MNYINELDPKSSKLLRECVECSGKFSVPCNSYRRKVCSDACRRKRVARITREWHTRNPNRESLYRERTKSKQLPDGNILRFFRWNPSAPRCCESCGEARVLEVAHKPGYERNGRGRCRENSVWPDMVWVLCPTCHSLIDRMRYPPEELGLK